MMTIDEIIEKRRRTWDNGHDIEYDALLVQKAVEYIHSNDALKLEIISKPWRLVEVAFTIVDKKKKTVPFFFNTVQQDFVTHLENRKKGRPLFALKGRQQGFTSLITAIQLAFAIVKRNFSGFTVANTQENTDSIFNDKARSVYDRLPSALKPHEKFNNRKEYYFDRINSSWRVATASKELGRSKTLEFCHFSEIAFYDCAMSDLQKSIGEALTADAIVIYESTANGFNEAKDLWDSGTCENLFYEWWKTEEYQSDDIGVLDSLNDAWIAGRVEWLKDKGLNQNQIAWYVAKYNSYLDKDSIRQEYPCMAEEAFIASGNCEFDNELVIKQMEACKSVKAVKRGYFDYRAQRAFDLDEDGIEITEVEWIDDENGEITIYEEPFEDKRGKKPYTIGGDTAGEGSDYFTAKVIDNMTGKTVATYRKQKTDDDLYADQIYCLGRYYHDALVGIEVNFSYEPTARLHRASYPNIYARERVDALTNRIDKRLGFNTTSLTRPVIISGLKRKWRESGGTIEVDLDTLKEMLTFVKNEKGKAEAIIGKHDDLVMALAIAHHVSEQGDHNWIDAPPEEIPEYMRDEYGGYKTAAQEYLSW